MRRVILVVVGAFALALGGGVEALAASGVRVVPASGKVAGKGYSYFLQRYWQIELGTTPPVQPCQTLRVNGHRVGLLTIATLTAGVHRYSCEVPAAEPVYAAMLSNECSTFKGDHGTFGTSSSQLEKCARAGVKGGKQTTYVDGRAVDVHPLVAATGVYRLRLPRRNVFDSRERSGRSAAYGYGLLLSGFSSGRHTIHSLASNGRVKFDITWTLHVR